MIQDRAAAVAEVVIHIGATRTGALNHNGGRSGGLHGVAQAHLALGTLGAVDAESVSEAVAVGDKSMGPVGAHGRGEGVAPGAVAADLEGLVGVGSAVLVIAPGQDHVVPLDGEEEGGPGGQVSGATEVTVMAGGHSGVLPGNIVGGHQGVAGVADAHAALAHVVIAPGHHAAVHAQGGAGGGAGGHSHHLAQLRLVIGAVQGAADGHGGEPVGVGGVAQLAAIVLAKSVDIAVLSEDQAVALAGGHSGGLHIAQAGDLDGVGAVGAVATAQLTLAVVAPGPDRAVTVHGQGVVGSGGDGHDAGQGSIRGGEDLSRQGVEAVYIVSGVAPAQLAVCIVAPGPDRTVGLERHGEVQAAGRHGGGHHTLLVLEDGDSDLTHGPGVLVIDPDGGGAIEAVGIGSDGTVSTDGDQAGIHRAPGKTGQVAKLLHLGETVEVEALGVVVLDAGDRDALSLSECEEAVLIAQQRAVPIPAEHDQHIQVLVAHPGGTLGSLVLSVGILIAPLAVDIAARHPDGAVVAHQGGVVGTEGQAGHRVHGGTLIGQILRTVVAHKETGGRGQGRRSVHGSHGVSAVVAPGPDSAVGDDSAQGKVARQRGGAAVGGDVGDVEAAAVGDKGRPAHHRAGADDVGVDAGSVEGTGALGGAVGHDARVVVLEHEGIVGATGDGSHVAAEVILGGGVVALGHDGVALDPAVIALVDVCMEHHAVPAQRGKAAAQAVGVDGDNAVDIAIPDQGGIRVSVLAVIDVAVLREDVEVVGAQGHIHRLLPAGNGQFLGGVGGVSGVAVVGAIIVGAVDHTELDVAPDPHLPVSVQGHGGVAAGGNGHDIGQGLAVLTDDLRGIVAVDSVPVQVHVGLIGGVDAGGAGGLAQAAPVVAAPGPDGAVSLERQGVVVAGGHLGRGDDLLLRRHVLLALRGQDLHGEEALDVVDGILEAEEGLAALAILGGGDGEAVLPGADLLHRHGEQVRVEGDEALDGLSHGVDMQVVPAVFGIAQVEAVVEPHDHGVDVHHDTLPPGELEEGADGVVIDGASVAVHPLGELAVQVIVLLLAAVSGVEPGLVDHYGVHVPAAHLVGKVGDRVGVPAEDHAGVLNRQGIIAAEGDLHRPVEVALVGRVQVGVVVGGAPQRPHGQGAVGVCAVAQLIGAVFAPQVEQVGHGARVSQSAGRHQGAGAAAAGVDVDRLQFARPGGVQGINGGLAAGGGTHTQLTAGVEAPGEDVAASVLSGQGHAVVAARGHGEHIAEIGLATLAAGHGIGGGLIEAVDLALSPTGAQAQVLVVTHDVDLAGLMEQKHMLIPGADLHDARHIGGQMEGGHFTALGGLGAAAGVAGHHAGADLLHDPGTVTAVLVPVLLGPGNAMANAVDLAGVAVQGQDGAAGGGYLGDAGLLPGAAAGEGQGGAGGTEAVDIHPSVRGGGGEIVVPGVHRHGGQAADLGGIGAQAGVIHPGARPVPHGTVSLEGNVVAVTCRNHRHGHVFLHSGGGLGDGDAQHVAEAGGGVADEDVGHAHLPGGDDNAIVGNGGAGHAGVAALHPQGVRAHGARLTAGGHSDEVVRIVGLLIELLEGDHQSLGVGGGVGGFVGVEAVFGAQGPSDGLALAVQTALDPSVKLFTFTAKAVRQASLLLGQGAGGVVVIVVHIIGAHGVDRALLVHQQGVLGTGRHGHGAPEEPGVLGGTVGIDDGGGGKVHGVAVGTGAAGEVGRGSGEAAALMGTGVEDLHESVVIAAEDGHGLGLVEVAADAQLAAGVEAPGKYGVVHSTGQHMTAAGLNGDDAAVYVLVEGHLHRGAAGGGAAVAQLAVGIVAPGVDLAVLGEGGGEAAAGSHPDHPAQVIGLGVEGACGHPDGGVGGGEGTVAQLAAAVGAPGEHGAVLTQGHRVGAARGDVNDAGEIAVALQAQDLSGVDTHIGIANTQLAAGVETPSPHGAVGLEGQSVAVAGGDGHNAGQGGVGGLVDTAGHQPVSGLLAGVVGVIQVVVGAAAQLALLVVAPAVHLAQVGQGQEEVIARIDADDVLSLCQHAEVHLHRVLLGDGAILVTGTALVSGGVLEVGDVGGVLAPEPHGAVSTQGQVVLIASHHHGLHKHVVGGIVQLISGQNGDLVIAPVVAAHMLHGDQDSTVAAAGGDEVPLAVDALEVGHSGIRGGEGDLRVGADPTLDLIADEVEGAVIDLQQTGVVDVEDLVSLEGHGTVHTGIGGQGGGQVSAVIDGRVGDSHGVIAAVAHLRENLGIGPGGVAALAHVVAAHRPHRALLTHHQGVGVTGGDEQVLSDVERLALHGGVAAALLHLDRQGLRLGGGQVDAQLAVSVVTPGPHGAVSKAVADEVAGDSQGVIIARRDLPHTSEIAGAVGVFHQTGGAGIAAGAGGEGVTLAQLAPEIAAPGVGVGVGSAVFIGAHTGGKGVVGASRDGEDVLEVETLVTAGALHPDGHLSTQNGGDAQLAVTVVAPSEEGAVAAQSQGVVSASGDGHDVPQEGPGAPVAAGAGEHLHHAAVVILAVARAQLAAAVVAPGPHGTVSQEGHGVARPGGDGHRLGLRQSCHLLQGDLHALGVAALLVIGIGLLGGGFLLSEVGIQVYRLGAAGEGVIPAVDVLADLLLELVPAGDDDLVHHGGGIVGAQLAVGIVAPGIDVPVASQSHIVVLPSGHRNDVHQAGDLNGNQVGLPVHQRPGGVGPSDAPGPDGAVGPQGNGAVAPGGDHRYCKVIFLHTARLVGVGADDLDLHEGDHVSVGIQHGHGGRAGLLQLGIGQRRGGEDTVSADTDDGFVTGAEGVAQGLEVHGGIEVGIGPEGEAVVAGGGSGQVDLDALAVVEGHAVIASGVQLRAIQAGEAHRHGLGRVRANIPGLAGGLALLLGAVGAAAQLAAGIVAPAQHPAVAGHDHAVAAAGGHNEGAGEHADATHVHALGSLPLGDLGLRYGGIAAGELIACIGAEGLHGAVGQNGQLVGPAGGERGNLVQSLLAALESHGQDAHGAGDTAAQLAGGVAAPDKGPCSIAAVVLGLVGDGTGEIAAGGDGHHTGHGLGSCAGIEDEVAAAVDRHGEEAVGHQTVAQLAGGTGTPGAHSVVGHQGQGEAVAGGHLGNMGELAQALAALDRHGGIVDAVVVLAQLAVVVAAHGVDHAALMEEQGVVGTGGDGYDAGEDGTLGVGDPGHGGQPAAVVAVGVDPPGVAAGGAHPHLELPALGVIREGFLIVIDLSGGVLHRTAAGGSAVGGIAARTQEGVSGAGVPGQAAAAQVGAADPVAGLHGHLPGVLIDLKDQTVALADTKAGVRLPLRERRGVVVGEVRIGVILGVIHAVIVVADDGGPGLVAVQDLLAPDLLLHSASGGILRVHRHGDQVLPQSVVGLLLVDDLGGKGLSMGGFAVPVGAALGHIVLLVGHLVGELRHALELAHRPDLAALRKQEGEGVARTDGDDMCKGIFIVSHLHRVSPLEEGAVAQLAIGVVAPSPDGAVTLQGHGVAEAGGDLGGCEEVIGAALGQDGDGDECTNGRALAPSQDLCGAVGPGKGEGAVGALGQDPAIQDHQLQVIGVDGLGTIVLVEVEAQIDVKFGGVGEGDDKLLVFPHLHDPVQRHRYASGAGGEVAPQLQGHEGLLAHPDGDVAALPGGEVTQLTQAIVAGGVHVAGADAHDGVLAAHGHGPGLLHVARAADAGGTRAVDGSPGSVCVIGHHYVLAALGVGLGALQGGGGGAQLAVGVVAPSQEGEGAGALIHCADQGTVIAGGDLSGLFGKQDGDVLGRLIATHLAVVIAAKGIYGAVGAHGNGVTIAGGDAHDLTDVSVVDGLSGALAQGHLDGHIPVEPPAVALTQLALGVVAPGPEGAILPQGIARRAPRGDLHHGGQVAAVGAGAVALDSLAGVGAQGMVRLALGQLAVGVAAPGVNVARLTQSHAELCPGVDVDNGVAHGVGGAVFIGVLLQGVAQEGVRVDGDTGRDRGAQGFPIGAHAQLAQLVAAPGPDVAEVIQRQGELVPGSHHHEGDGPALLIGKAGEDAHRLIDVAGVTVVVGDVVAFVVPVALLLIGGLLAVAQLAVGVLTPGVDLAQGGQGHGVVFPGGDHGDSSHGRGLVVTSLPGIGVLLHMAHGDGKHHGIHQILGAIPVDDGYSGGAQLGAGLEGHQHAAGSGACHSLHAQDGVIGGGDGELVQVRLGGPAVRVEVEALKEAVGDVAEVKAQELILGQILAGGSLLAAAILSGGVAVALHVGGLAILTQAVDLILLQDQGLGLAVAGLNGLLGGGVGAVAQLAIGVIAPVPDIVVLLEGGGVVVAQGYLQRTLEGISADAGAVARSHDLRQVGVADDVGAAIGIGPAQLMGAVVAPEVNIARLTGNGGGAVSTGGNGVDLARIGEQHVLGQHSFLIGGGGGLGDDHLAVYLDGGGVVGGVAGAAVAQLAIAVIAPGLHSAVREKDQAVALAGGHLHGVGEHLHRHPIIKGKDMLLAGGLGLRIGDGDQGVGVVAHAQLAVGIVAPGEDGTVGAQGQGMGSTGGEGDNVGQGGGAAGALALVDPAGHRHVAGVGGGHGILRQGAVLQILIVLFEFSQILRVELAVAGVAHAQLAPVVEAHAPDLALPGEQYGVAVPGVDRAAVLRHAGHGRGGSTHPAEGALTQLSMEVAAPGVDGSVGRQGHGVVTASSHGDDAGEGRAALQHHLAGAVTVGQSLAVLPHAQLALAVVAPGPDGTVSLQGHGEVLAQRDGRQGSGGHDTVLAGEGIQHIHPQQQGVAGGGVVDAHGGRAGAQGGKGSAAHREDAFIADGHSHLAQVLLRVALLALAQQELGYIALGKLGEGDAVPGDQSHALIQGTIPAGDVGIDGDGAAGLQEFHVVATGHFDLVPVHRGHLAQLAVVVAAPGVYLAVGIHRQAEVAAGGDGGDDRPRGELHLYKVVGPAGGVYGRSPCAVYVLKHSVYACRQLPIFVISQDIEGAGGDVAFAISATHEDQGMSAAHGHIQHTGKPGDAGEGGAVVEVIGVVHLHAAAGAGQYRVGGNRHVIGGTQLSVLIGAKDADRGSALASTAAGHDEGGVGAAGGHVQHAHDGVTGGGRDGLNRDGLIPGARLSLPGQVLVVAQLAILIGAPAVNGALDTALQGAQGKGVVCAGKNLYSAGEGIVGVGPQHGAGGKAQVVLAGAVGGTVAQLAQIIVAPAEHAALSAHHGKGVLITGSQGGGAGEVGAAAGLTGEHPVGNAPVLLISQAQLALVVAAPGVDGTVVGAGQNVVAAHGHLGDEGEPLGSPLQAQHLHGEGGIGHLFAGVADAQLAICVVAPGPDGAVSLQGHGEVLAGKDLGVSEVVGIQNLHIEGSPVDIAGSLLSDGDEAVDADGRVLGGRESGVVDGDVGHSHHSLVTGGVLEGDIALLTRGQVHVVAAGPVPLAEVEAHLVVAAGPFLIYINVLQVGNGENLGQLLLHDGQGLRIGLQVHAGDAGVPVGENGGARDDLAGVLIGLLSVNPDFVENQALFIFGSGEHRDGGAVAVHQIGAQVSVAVVADGAHGTVAEPEDSEVAAGAGSGHRTCDLVHGALAKVVLVLGAPNFLRNGVVLPVHLGIAALAQLVIVVVAPGVGFAVPGDGDGVVVAGSEMGHIEHAAVVRPLDGHRSVGVLGGIVAQLAPGTHAPAVNGGVVGGRGHGKDVGVAVVGGAALLVGDRQAAAGGDLHHVGGHGGAHPDGHKAVPHTGGGLADAQLTVGVVTPGVDIAVGGERHGENTGSGDLDHFLHPGHLDRPGGVHLSADTKLTLGVAAPGPDVTVLIQSQRVAVTCGNGHDAAEGRSIALPDHPGGIGGLPGAGSGLAVFIEAPGVDVAVFGKRQRVAAAGGHHNDALQHAAVGVGADGTGRAHAAQIGAGQAVVARVAPALDGAVSQQGQGVAVKGAGHGDGELFLGVVGIGTALEVEAGNLHHQLPELALSGGGIYLGTPLAGGGGRDNQVSVAVQFHLGDAGIHHTLEADGTLESQLASRDRDALPGGEPDHIAPLHRLHSLGVGDAGLLRVRRTPSILALRIVGILFFVGARRGLLSPVGSGRGFLSSVGSSGGFFFLIRSVGRLLLPVLSLIRFAGLVGIFGLIRVAGLVGVVQGHGSGQIDGISIGGNGFVGGELHAEDGIGLVQAVGVQILVLLLFIVLAVSALFFRVLSGSLLVLRFVLCCPGVLRLRGIFLFAVQQVFRGGSGQALGGQRQYGSVEGGLLQQSFRFALRLVFLFLRGLLRPRGAGIIRSLVSFSARGGLSIPGVLFIGLFRGRLIAASLRGGATAHQVKSAVSGGAARGLVEAVFKIRQIVVGVLLGQPAGAPHLVEERLNLGRLFAYIPGAGALAAGQVIRAAVRAVAHRLFSDPADLYGAFHGGGHILSGLMDDPFHRLKGDLVAVINPIVNSDPVELLLDLELGLSLGTVGDAHFLPHAGDVLPLAPGQVFHPVQIQSDGEKGRVLLQGQHAQILEVGHSGRDLHHPAVLGKADEILVQRQGHGDLTAGILRVRSSFGRQLLRPCVRDGFP